MDPLAYGQLIFDKDTKTIQWRKVFFNKSVGIIGYPKAKI